jgi:hypothetical protein
MIIMKAVSLDRFLLITNWTSFVFFLFPARRAVATYEVPKKMDEA